MVPSKTKSVAGGRAICSRRHLDSQRQKGCWEPVTVQTQKHPQKSQKQRGWRAREAMWGGGEQGRAEVENTREAGDSSILPASRQL